jgi:hypothetical protein
MKHKLWNIVYLEYAPNAVVAIIMQYINENLLLIHDKHMIFNMSNTMGANYETGTVNLSFCTIFRFYIVLFL